jgi:hypothetical protein
MRSVYEALRHSLVRNIAKPAPLSIKIGVFDRRFLANPSAVNVRLKTPEKTARLTATVARPCNVMKAL